MVEEDEPSAPDGYQKLGTVMGRQRAVRVVSRCQRREGEGGCERNSDYGELVGRRPDREEDAVKTVDLDLDLDLDLGLDADAGDGGEDAGAIEDDDEEEEGGEDRYTAG